MPYAEESMICLSILTVRYDTIKYDIVYLTCSIKLTCSHHTGQTERFKKRTKNKTRSMMSPVRSRDREGSPG